MSESKTVGERMGSPYFVSALSSEVIGAFSRAAARGPLQGFNGDLKSIALSSNEWKLLRADLDDVLEKYLTIVADQFQLGVTRVTLERDEADRVLGVLTRRLAALQGEI